VKNKEIGQLYTDEFGIQPEKQEIIKNQRNRPDN
jgi:hypothetical protein